ncbi:MAG: hypothetical protein JXQ29_11095 [Planctomycetes bacterium]|nr:hypothetical protein [Planctomycetota bacterium]
MTTKAFDAVKLMRELRDRLSQEMEHMTPEERVRYISAEAASTGLAKKFTEDDEDAAQQADGANRPAAGG